MPFLQGNIISKDGIIVAEAVEIYIDFFCIDTTNIWDGSFEIPATTILTHDTYRIQLSDGRQGTITNINIRVSGDNIMVYFEGKGPLQ